MNQGAREIRRRRYLQAMGLDSYISRRPLPGAGRTKRLAIVHTAAHPPEAARVAPEPPAAGPEAPTPTMARAALASTTGAELPAAKPAAPRPAARAPIESFSVAAVLVGGVLWLEELAQPPVAPEQVQLLRALASALGRPGQDLAVTRFDWPIHRNAQFDLGEEAAHAGLAGFISRKLEQHPCDALVLLGDAVRRRVRAGEYAELPQLQTVSTAEMLARPISKRQAWRDLRTLVRT